MDDRFINIIIIVLSIYINIYQINILIGVNIGLIKQQFCFNLSEKYYIR